MCNVNIRVYCPCTGPAHDFDPLLRPVPASHFSTNPQRAVDLIALAANPCPVCSTIIARWGPFCATHRDFSPPIFSRDPLLDHPREGAD